MKLIASILLERLTRETSNYLDVTSNGPINQNNPEPSTGLIKDPPDATSNFVVADSQAAKATPQGTGNLQTVTHDRSSQDTTNEKPV